MLLLSVASIPYFAAAAAMFGLGSFLFHFRSELSQVNFDALPEFSKRFWANGRIKNFYVLAALLAFVFGIVVLAQGLWL